MTGIRHDPHPVRSRVLLAHGERIDWHDHAVHQLIHPRRGVLLIATSGGEWIVPPHRAVWVPARVAHSHTAHGATDMRCTAFPAHVNPLRLAQPAVLAVTPLVREAIGVLSGDGHLPAAHRRHIEQVVLDQLRRVEVLRAHLPLPADPRLRDVMDLLRADPADPRTLTALGRAVGASERTLSRLFRAQTGMTFPQWRTQLRLHHALTLLAAGARVTETATACGWSGPSPFIQAFRAAFGTTPGLYGRQDAPRPLSSASTDPAAP
jgi:AraC-like DNA-binding protein